MGTSTINAGSAHSRSATTGNGSQARGVDGSLTRGDRARQRAAGAGDLTRCVGLAGRVGTAAAIGVLAAAVVALDAQRARAVGRGHDDRVHPIDLAGPAEILDRLAGAE